MALTAATKTELYRFFTIAFNAAPGVTYMNQLAAAAEVMTVKQIVDVFTAKPEFTASYPTFFTNSQFATKLIDTVVGSSATTAAKAEAVADIEAALAAGLSKGTVIFNVFSNLAALTGDAKWGGTATQLANKVAVAQYYTEDLLTDTTNLTTLRNVIANVTNTTDVSTTAAIQAVINVAAPVSGQTFTLTTSADTTLTGGSGDDTYTGLTIADNGTGTTLTAGDNLSGGAGTDTLNVNISGASTALVTVSAVTLASVEKVLVSNFDTNTDDTEDHDFNTALWTGLTTLGLSSSAALGDTKFSNVASIVTAEMKSGAGDLEIDYAASAVTGTADTQTLVLDAVSAGTFTADAAVETVAVTAASTASASTLTDLVATGATKITIDSDVALTITGALDATAVTVDGSASAGALSLNFTAAAADLAITGGSGNDTFTFDATGTLTAADTINGGAGTDTIVADIDSVDTTATATAFTKISAIETLSVSGDIDHASDDVTTANIQAGISRVNYSGVISAANDLTLEAGDKTVGFGAINTAALTVNDTGTATTDSLTILNTDTTGTDDNFGGMAYTTSGWETVTYNTGSAATAAQTLGAVVANVDTGAGLAFNVTGANNLTTFTSLTTNSTGAVTISASGMTAKADGTNTFTLSNVAFSGTAGTISIVGSAGMDTITSSNVRSTIDGGAGRDSLTGGTAADSLIGGADNDTLVGAGGNDVISGGDGVDTINVSGAAGETNVSGGAGNDTIIINSRLSASDTIDGGDGIDTIAINATDITALNGMTFGQGSTLNGNISNIEKVSVGALASSGTSTNILDMSRLDNINYVVLTAAGVAATQVSGMVDASTVEITGDMGDTDTLTLAYASTTGTQSLTLVANFSATADLGVVAAAGIENVTVNSTSTNATPSGVTNTLGLTIAAATTLTVTGNSILDANESAINATTINASANTAGFHVLGGSANQTITGTSAADNIDGGAGADTISGGSGADTLAGGSGADSITAGEGADTITGGSGNDTIVLTETTAAVDDVVINYSEAGASIDTVTGFATTSSGDEIQISISALNAAAASGGIVSGQATVLNQLDANTAVDAAASTVQVMTTAAAAAAGADVFVLSGATFSTADEIEDALETGGAFELTIAAASDVANNSFIVVYSNGTDTKVAAVHITAVTANDTNFEAGNLNVIDLVTLTGISSIGSTTFAGANFEFIA
jgi:Ca2+-binding RTX toxin-like protein